MARRKRRRMSRKAVAGFRYAGAAAGLGSRYSSAKRAYHEAGNALYKSKHGGRSIRSRKRRTKHRRSR